MMIHAHSLASQYDPQLVVLSVITAVLASYTALDVAARVTAARGLPRATWLACGAFAMGLGIWSMHYIGMLAFQMDVPVFYDIPLVVVSLAAAVFASAVALWVVSRPEMGSRRAIPGSLVMGAGVAAMHYTGMAAMRVGATLTYDPALLSLSIGIAVVVAYVAMVLAFHFRSDHGLGWAKFASAVLMGASIPAMHYVGMAAATFTPLESAATFAQPAYSIDIGALGIAAVAFATFVVLGLTIVTSRVDAMVIAHSAALRESEAGRRAQELFLREVIDAHPQMVFAKDLDGRYTLVNRAVATLYGREPNEVVGRTDAELMPGLEQVDRFVEQDRTVITTGEPLPIREEPVVDVATGELRWFETIKVPLRAPDGTMQVLGVATDVTQHRKLEEQLRHALKMEAVGRLAGGVAHDFNNLLTAILGNAECVLEDMEDQPHAPHREELREIVDAGRRAATLTRQLLAFSRKQMLQPKVLDLNSVVGNLHRLLVRLIGEDIELRTVAGHGLWDVEADPGQLEQVVVNVVVNARDAMPRGGRLSIRTANVDRDQLAARERELMPAREYVMLSITDSGVGMSEDVLAHLFEPFFTTKPAGKGTGLGLATVYGIVKQSGGFVWVDSTPGEGSTFRIYLPRAQRMAEPDGVPDDVQPLPAGRGTILVVEDDAAVRKVTTRVLSGRGYRVIEASSGDEAVAAAHRLKGALDLLVTDVVMPRMSGREVAATVSRIRPGLKVLYVSGYTDDAILRHGVVKEGVSLLQKPFTPLGLAQRVHDILSATPPLGVEALREAV